MISITLRRASLLAVLCATILTVVAPVATAGTAAQDLAWLNAKRAANGIPGNLTLNADWSTKCAQHVAYMRATNTVTHEEDPSSPSFSEGGNWAAANAVLASTTPWTQDNFIWETAPMHLSQLLAPQLSQVGIADDGRFVCVTTWPGYLRPAPPKNSIVTYPGNGTSIYSSEITDELPTTPAATLGLNQQTGPHLYVYGLGPGSASGTTTEGKILAISSATLRGPTGLVPLRWADPTTPEIGQYLPSASGIIIPTQPLEDRASYVATVTFNNGLTHTWGFTALPTPSGYAVQNVGIAVRDAASHRVRMTIRGRLVNQVADTELGNVPVAITIGEKTLTITTAPDGRFSKTVVMSGATARGSAILTLRAADALTAAYDVPLSPRQRSTGSVGSGVSTSSIAVLNH